jgi:metal-sulfur cluster biosynthetic enzyme
MYSFWLIQFNSASFIFLSYYFGMNTAQNESISRDTVIEKIKLIEDPDLFLDIWFLGLIYDIRIEGARVEIDMTFTTPTCPSGPHLVQQVELRVGEIEGVSEVDVRVVFSPVWAPSDEVKGLLGMI